MPDLIIDDSELSRPYNRQNVLTERHLGPGPHPGTGTDQEVHGPDKDRSSQIAEALKDRYHTIENLANLPSSLRGWILPDGTLVQINEEHFDTIQKISMDLGIFDDDRFGHRAYEHVFDHGFIRVNLFNISKPGYRNSINLQLKPDPPRAARQTLRDIFAVIGVDSSIVYELGGRTGRSLREFERVSGVTVTRKEHGPDDTSGI